ncbi:MAG: hypothetical protein ACUVX8_03635 [Candidatus Zipacnadales bacterium]
MERHCDTHSVLVDAGVWEEVQRGSPYVSLAKDDVLPEAGFTNRAAGDYLLLADSPLQGRGITLPPQLNSPYQPGPEDQILSRAWATTLVVDAPSPEEAVSVYGGEKGHYRLQPLPRLHALIDLDACSPGTPGLNAEWAASGAYPRFVEGEADVVTADDWIVLPDNLIDDPSFDKPFGTDDNGDSPWKTVGGVHQYGGMACANLRPSQTQIEYAYQKVGTVRAHGEYILYGEMSISSRSDRLAGIGEMYLAAGDPTRPLHTPLLVRADPGRTKHWGSYDLRLRVEPGETVGQDLYVVLAGRIEGPEEGGKEAVAFVRWDNIWLLTSPAGR